MKTIVLHRTFDKTTEYKGEPVFYVSSSKGVKKLVGGDINKFLDKLTEGVTLRLTATGGFEAPIIHFQNQGVNVVTAHWHGTGIEKGLTPEEIVEKFAALPDELFSVVSIREDLFNLKNRVKTRSALMDYRKKLNQRLMQVQRSYGFGDKDELPEGLSFLAEDKQEAKEATGEAESAADKKLLEAARLVPEYQIMSEIMGVAKEGFSAAGAVAYIGDPQRFATVSKLWKYAGYHVVDGKAAKRTKGQQQDWNGKLKTTMWNFVDSAIKNNKKWRPVYDSFLQAELVAHPSKCECKYLESHSKAMARRRISKEVLRLYFAATHGQLVPK